MIRVLYVDDEEGLLDIGKTFLERAGYLIVDTVLSANKAKERLLQHDYDAIVSDYQMPGENGIEFLKDLRSRNINVPFILFTGKGREEVAIEALNTGADFYIQKGGNPQAQFVELEYKIKIAVQRRESELSIKRLNRELLAIKNINQLILHVRTEKELLEKTCSNFCDVGGYMLAWIGFPEGDPERSIRPVAWAGFDEQYVRNAKVTWNDEERGQGPTGSAVRTGKTRYIQDWDKDPRISPWKKEGSKYGYRSSIALPIKVHDMVLGVLTLYTNMIGGFTTNEIQMLEEIVGDLAYGIENLRNNEEKAKAEERFRRSEERFSKAFYGSGADMLLARADDGRVIEVNDAWIGSFGYSREELIGHSTVQLGIWRYPEQRDEVIRELRKIGYVRDREYEFVGKKDRRLVGLFSSQLIKVDGEEYMLSCSVNITERKEAEEELTDSKDKLAIAMDLAGLAQWDYDVLNDRFYFDDRFYTLYGTTAEQEGGHFISEQQYLTSFVPAEEVETVSRFIRYILSPENFNNYPQIEHNILRRDGELRHIVVRVHIVRDENGRPIRTHGVNQDITDRVNAEEALRKSEEMFNKAFHSNVAAMSMAYLEDGEYIEVNEQWERMFGRTKAETVGRTAKEIGIWANIKDRNEMQEELKNKGYFIDSEFILQRKDGEPRTSLNSARVIDLDGRDVILASIIDITERKRNELAIKKANHQLSILTTITGHDMINQLAALEGYTQLIKMGEDGSSHVKRIELLRKMENSIRNLQNQADFIQKYQEIGMKMPKWQDLHDIIGKVKKQFLLGDLEIIEEGTDVLVLADPMFEKVVLNMVDNVLRHGRGAKHLTASINWTADNSTLIFEDDGEGIKGNERIHLFERGYGKNMGFGLFMTREILNITGMTINETSTKGKGARFEINIPSCKIKKNEGQSKVLTQ